MFAEAQVRIRRLPDREPLNFGVVEHFDYAFKEQAGLVKGRRDDKLAAGLRAEKSCRDLGRASIRLAPPPSAREHFDAGVRLQEPPLTRMRCPRQDRGVVIRRHYLGS